MGEEKQSPEDELAPGTRGQFAASIIAQFLGDHAEQK